jgi:hypothetical protein
MTERKRSGKVTYRSKGFTRGGQEFQWCSIYSETPLRCIFPGQKNDISVTSKRTIKV